MKIAGIIPARYASTRFPGKPLADIMGKSMIRRVFEQSSKCRLLDVVIVATDDQRIFEEVEKYGGKAVMTSMDHSTGTERCLEAATLACPDADVILNIQGDEPFIDPEQIGQVAGLFSDSSVNISTLMKKISSATELFDPNVVKVVTGNDNNAIYFSRNPIPYLRGLDPENWTEQLNFFRHVGIYGYRRNVLEEIVNLPPSPLEKAESLEQLRWIWNGFTIRVKETEYESISVDVPSDLLKFTNKG